MNCWEFKKCGREPGGYKVSTLGVCEASKHVNANGLNRGLNGGRACWAISGTLCGDKVQGTFAAKVAECLKCDFYQKVKDEEGIRFKNAKDILRSIVMNSKSPTPARNASF